MKLGEVSHFALGALLCCSFSGCTRTNFSVESDEPCPDPGALRYDVETGAFLVCDASGWQPLAGESDPGALLEIAPTVADTFNVYPTGRSPARSTAVTFEIRNVTPWISDELVLIVSPVTTFLVENDTCSGIFLKGGESCTLALRAQAYLDGPLAGELRVFADNNPRAELVGSATGLCRVGEAQGGGTLAACDESYYLIAAPGDCEAGTNTPACAPVVDLTMLLWSGSTSNERLGASSSTDGPFNTAILVAAPGVSPAAEYCDAAQIGGYDDWYLPASEELSLVHGALLGTGTFQAGRYWTSTEQGTSEAITLNFLQGDLEPYRKNYYAYVRCVRRDTTTPLPATHPWDSANCGGQGCDGVVRRVFVTRRTYIAATMSGVQGGDAHCQQAANLANIGGAWQAWLSSSAEDDWLINRMDYNWGRLETVTGELIADHPQLLWDPTQSLLRPISLDQWGESRHGAVWTGTYADGTSNPNPLAAMHCGQWGQVTWDRGWQGNSSAISSQWVDAGWAGLCYSAGALYCAEVDSTPPPAADGLFLDTPIDASAYESCAQVLASGASVGSGHYLLDLDGPAGSLAPTVTYCDMTTDGGGWMLILNEQYARGEVDSAGEPLSESLPRMNPRSELGNSEMGSPFFGHVIPSTLAQLTYSELRFWCTSTQGLTAHFKTDLPSAVDYANSGVGSFDGIAESHTTLDGHNGTIPANATGPQPTDGGIGALRSFVGQMAGRAWGPYFYTGASASSCETGSAADARSFHMFVR